MQMIQDGQYANAPEKPLRMTGTAEACRVCLLTAIVLYRAHYHLCALLPQPLSLCTGTILYYLYNLLFTGATI